MTLITERLPRTVELGSVREEIEDVEINSSDDGSEIRNMSHDQSKYMWTLAFPPKDPDDANIESVLAMYRVTRGGLHSFLWQDLLEKDYTLTAHQIGVGDGSTTAFQIAKTVTVGATSVARDIRKPRSGTVQVYKDAVLQGSGYTVDYTTGIITFTVAPANAVVITVTCTYDYAVRFDSPLSSKVLTDWLQGIESLTVVEVFNE